VRADSFNIDDLFQPEKEMNVQDEIISREEATK
jgi:hypothetical protein